MKCLLCEVNSVNVMTFFQIRFHFISSIKQINSSKNFSSQMETVATKRNVTDVTEPFTDAET